MPKGQDLSAHQRGIVKRYYANIDTITANTLGELVSELYLAEPGRKTNALWKRVSTALNKTPVEPERVARILESRDVKLLARLVSDLQSDRAGDRAGSDRTKR